MGQPAARVGDMTSHGTPLGGPAPSRVNVLIGGRPAWKAVADFHACPLVSGIAHVGGFVEVGSATVLINNMPAVRQGDTIVEVGPPNTVVQGCPTVFIG